MKTNEDENVVARLLSENGVLKSIADGQA